MSAQRLPATTQCTQEIGQQGDLGKTSYLAKTNEAQSSGPYPFSLSGSRCQLHCTALRMPKQVLLRGGDDSHKRRDASGAKQPSTKVKWPRRKNGG